MIHDVRFTDIHSSPKGIQPSKPAFPLVNSVQAKLMCLLISSQWTVHLHTLYHEDLHVNRLFTTLELEMFPVHVTTMHCPN